MISFIILLVYQFYLLQYYLKLKRNYTTQYFLQLKENFNIQPKDINLFITTRVKSDKNTIEEMFSIFKKEKEEVQRSEMVSPGRKKLSEIFYQQKSAKLPVDFAQNIMQLEMQLEFAQSYSLQVVMKLNELYRIAIQHYINEDSRKANHFQRKLTTLLTNPQTLDLMDKKTLENKKNIQKEDSDKKQVKPCVGVNYNSNLRKQMNQFNCQSQMLVKSIIEGTQKKVERNHRFVQTHLTNQQQKLKMRLQQRSRSKKQRSIDPKK